VCFHLFSVYDARFSGFVCRRLKKSLSKFSYFCPEQLTRILRILGVLLPKTADSKPSTSDIETPFFQPL
jgi:hypothetical protein